MCFSLCMWAMWSVAFTWIWTTTSTESANANHSQYASWHKNSTAHMRKTAWSNYQKGAFIISVNDNFYPIFAKVIDVLLIVIVDILEVSRYTVDYFDNHFHAYFVFPSSQKSVLINCKTTPYYMHTRKKVFCSFTCKIMVKIMCFFVTCF